MIDADRRTGGTGRERAQPPRADRGHGIVDALREGDVELGDDLQALGTGADGQRGRPGGRVGGQRGPAGGLDVVGQDQGDPPSQLGVLGGELVDDRGERALRPLRGPAGPADDAVDDGGAAGPVAGPVSGLVEPGLVLEQGGQGLREGVAVVGGQVLGQGGEGGGGPVAGVVGLLAGTGGHAAEELLVSHGRASPLAAGPHASRQPVSAP